MSRDDVMGEYIGTKKQFLVSVDVQKGLADQIDKITDEIKELRNSALQNRTIALKNFETPIFD